MALDRRIGIRNEDGTVKQWPEVGMDGQPVASERVQPQAVAVARPTINLDRHHFVVVGLFPPQGYKGEVEKLRAGLERMADAPAKRISKDS